MLQNEVAAAVEFARGAAARNMNAVMTAAYWEIRRRIVKSEEGGESRAGYGQALVVQLAGDLTRRFGRGFGRANLVNMRAFYISLPDDDTIQTVSGKSGALGIVQTPSGQLPLRKGKAATPAATNGIPAPRRALYFAIVSVLQDQFCQAKAMRKRASKRRRRVIHIGVDALRRLGGQI